MKNCSKRIALKVKIWSLIFFFGSIVLSFGGTLEEEIREQESEIRKLRDDIDAVILDIEKNKIIREKRDLYLTQKAQFEADLALKEQLQLQIKNLEAELPRLEIEWADYRKDYRRYIRRKAIGEEFESVTLRNGKFLKNVKIVEIGNEKIRFKTEYGSSSVEWRELPESWLDRFQYVKEEAITEKGNRNQSGERAYLQRIKNDKEKRVLGLRRNKLQREIAAIEKQITFKEAKIADAEAQLSYLDEKSKEVRTRVYTGSTDYGSFSAPETTTVTRATGASKKARRDAVELRQKILRMKTLLKNDEKSLAKLEQELSKLE